MAIAAVTAAGLVALAGAPVACSDAAPTAPETPNDAAIHRDVVQVDPPVDGGTGDAAPPPGPSPSCDSYCGTVMTSCKGAEAQYLSLGECEAFCQALPAGDAGDTKGPSVACRQYYAGSPAETDPAKYCPAAGAWGGGVCGDDRCIAFCTTALAYCSPDAGDGGKDAPYASYADCAAACATFSYKDAGAGENDGGSEGLYGPTQGNTLNCRLFHLREVVRGAATGCEAIAPDAGACN